MSDKPERIKPVKKGKYPDVTAMIRDLAGDSAFADGIANRVRQRGVIDHLMAQRAAQGLSQKDIAQRMGCTQSRISKLEAGKDDDLRAGDLEAYATALGLNVVVHFSKQGATIADRVKYHVLTARKLLLRIAELSAEDPTMADGANNFFAEVLHNAARAVFEAARNLDAANKNGLLSSLPVEPPPVVQMEGDEELKDCEPSESVVQAAKEKRKKAPIS